jgi:tyrosine-protein kinase Etk/Wzc
MQSMANTNHSPVNEDRVDIRQLLIKYRQYWYVFLISIILGLTGAYIINTVSEPVYRVKATLLIQEETPASPLMRTMDFFSRPSNTQNQLMILESFSMIDSTLANLDVSVSYYEMAGLIGRLPVIEIYRNSPFRVSFDKDHPQPFGEKFTLTIIDENWYELSGIKGLRDFDEKEQYFFGQKMQGRGHFFTINHSQNFSKELHAGKTYQFVINDVSRLARRYKLDMEIEPLSPEASVFEISFKATNRHRALDFVNTLKNTFIQQNLQQKNQTAQNTVQFIENQIALTAGNLSATEGRLQNFREKQQLIDLSAMASQLVDELQALDRERSLVEVRQSYYDFLLDYVSDRRDFSEVFAPTALGIDDPILNSLLVDLSKLHAERSRLLLNTTERSPSVQAIDQNIKQFKATLEENIKNIQAASGILMNDLNRRINRLEQRISQLPSTERELLGIQRMFNITDATYNFLLEKQAEAGIALASNMADHKIIDQAYYDRKVSPMNTLNYILGVFLALGLPFIIIGFRDFFNTRIQNKEQVIRALNFPILGIVPRFKALVKKKEVDIIIFDQPFSPVTESFRNIRSNLHFFSPKKDNNLIVVTSARSGEGKTFTAINLAAILAMSDKRTLYIDADIRKIQPNKFTSNMIDVGLSNYLIGRAGLDDIINPSSYNKHLFIMNSGVASPNPAELIESEEMMQLLTKNLKDFEYVIVDTSPVGLVADAKPLMALARLNLFVLRHNFSNVDDMEFIRDYTSKAGLKNIVIAINDVKQTKSGYGYGYGFGYGFGYGTLDGKSKSVTVSSQ